MRWGGRGGQGGQGGFNITISSRQGRRLQQGGQLGLKMLQQWQAMIQAEYAVPCTTNFRRDQAGWTFSEVINHGREGPAHAP